MLNSGVESLLASGKKHHLIVIFIGLNLIITWFLHGHIANGVFYVANDAWQFVDDPFLKTRGVSRFLTIPLYPVLHNLNPNVAVLLDSFSFALILASLFLRSKIKSKQLLLVLACGLTLPFWVVVTQWYRWPGQMFAINVVTAFFFWVSFREGSKFRHDIVISGLFVFFAMAYYEIYCLFALMLPFIKRYTLKQYLVYLFLSVMFIGLAYLGSKFYQYYFFDISEISVGYRQLVKEVEGAIILQYLEQFFAAVQGTVKAWFISIPIGIIAGLLMLSIVVTSVKASKKYLHTFVFIGMFIGMFALTNHTILQRSAAPLYFLPFILVLSKDEFDYPSIFGLSAICLLYLYGSICLSIPVHKARSDRIVNMKNEIVENISSLLVADGRAKIVIGSGKSSGWAFYDLNAVSYSLQRERLARITWCGEQYIWGACGVQVKNDVAFRDWLCSGPDDWAFYQTDKITFISLGSHYKLSCE